MHSEVDEDSVKRMNSGPGDQRRKRSRWMMGGIIGLIAAGITISVLMVSHQWRAVNPTDKTSKNQKQNVLASKTPANEYYEKQERPEQGTGIHDEKRPPSIETSQALDQAVFRDTLADGSLGPEMVVIQPGSFRMGDIQRQGPAFEKPVHTVYIAKVFAIGRYEVRFEEYDQFARATGRRLPKDRGWGRGSRPVINVSWDDAGAYAKWLSQQTGKHYRLPSEAEWEYAARAGTATAYWWGNDIGHNRAACDGCGSQWDRKQTAPVGSFEPNPYGLYDTAGNVWEWVQDCKIDNYKNVPTDGSAWLLGDCPERVFRGGSWNVPPHKLRSAKRTWDNPGLRYSYVGFRLAQDL